MSLHFFLSSPLWRASSNICEPNGHWTPCPVILGPRSPRQVGWWADDSVNEPFRGGFFTREHCAPIIWNERLQYCSTKCTEDHRCEGCEEGKAYLLSGLIPADMACGPSPQATARLLSLTYWMPWLFWKLCSALYLLLISKQGCD